jgi:20S proteasome alpha/beta subunit
MNNWKTPNMFGTYHGLRTNSCTSNLKTDYWRRENMTYILGARCSDGVVLIGDTKVTTDYGAHERFIKKIDIPLHKDCIGVNSPLNEIVMGSAGIASVYEALKNKMTIKVRISFKKTATQAHELQVLQTKSGFEDLVLQSIRELYQDYGQDRYELMNELKTICASRLDGARASLIVFHPDGSPEQVIDDYRAIGCGEPHGSIFLKKMWSPDWTMEQTAKLGIFIIKYINHMKLDNRVGFSDEFLPQVFYIPDIVKPIGSDQLSDEEALKLIKDFEILELKPGKILNFMNEVKPMITVFENFIQSENFEM